MAWRSSGTNNQSMVDNLKRFGVVRTSAVETAFRNVDRKYFVPRNQITLAHADQPLREDHVHISAPHIYGTALEALELEAGSSQSFLNLGSGTGYLSCMVANVLGPHAVHVAVEVQPDTIRHAKQSWQRWEAANPNLSVPECEFIHGNALHIDTEQGEAITGFDRIYVGATVSRRKLHRLAQLLRPGGILVGPVDDDLVKVMRVGEGNASVEETNPALPRSLRGHPPVLPSDYSVQILSGVRFASLVELPLMPTILPSRIWEPAMHARYPDSFRMACKEILLCSQAACVQALKPQPTVVVNAAAILPRALWMEILSYTTRDWFNKPRNTEELLRRRLKEEQSALNQAQEARQRAEARVVMMERERDLYKALLLRCQTRLRAALGDANMPEDAFLLAAGDNDNDDDDDGVHQQQEVPRLMAAVGRQGGFLRALRLLTRRNVAGGNLQNAQEDEDNEGQQDVDLEDSDDDGSEAEMEDVIEGNNEDGDDDDDDDDATAMEEDTEMFSGAVGRRPQARTVSISESEF